MIKCICVDDTNRPEDFPLKKWIKKDNVYHITHVYYHINQGVQGVELSEIDLSNCEPYQSFKLKRFAIPLEELTSLLELIKSCNKLNDVDINIDKLIEEFELI